MLDLSKKTTVDIKELLESFKSHFHTDRTPPLKWDWDPFTDNTMTCVYCDKEVIKFPLSKSLSFHSTCYHYKDCTCWLRYSPSCLGSYILEIEHNARPGILEEVTTFHGAKPSEQDILLYLEEYFTNST